MPIHITDICTTSDEKEVVVLNILSSTEAVVTEKKGLPFITQLSSLTPKKSIISQILSLPELPSFSSILVKMKEAAEKIVTKKKGAKKTTKKVEEVIDL